LENLGLPAAEIDMRLERALEGFDLGAMRLRSPHSLSGGEQQKLALAAITARQPPLLILDEPLSMLDVSASADFVAHLGAQAANGVAAVICEHRHEALLGLPGLRLAPMDGCINEIPAPDDEFEPASLGNACDCRLEGQGLTIMRGARPVLQGLDCSFQGGEITALVGRNGVGKTTLLKALAGLQPYQGELEARRDGRKEKPDLGIVFQNPDLQLFNPSARQEMLYGIAQPDQGLYTGLIQALDLERYQDTPPLLLSEGEKRRLALGTALMRCPRHGILLDEPALGQDEAHKAMLMRLLHQVARTGQVVVLATHDIDLARRADRLVLLGKEGFVASGPPDQVLSDIAAWEKLGLRLPSWLKPAVPLKHRVTLVERSTDVEH
jgi:energy-coupling factor transporter ATP-binding protein EcfA2